MSRLGDASGDAPRVAGDYRGNSISTESPFSLRRTLPLVGFLPATDPRMVGTVKAIRERLVTDGMVRRYVPETAVDGLPEGEGIFIACTFWLADNLALQGRYDEAREIFERLLSITNDVGLLSEQYDPIEHRFLGNFPQAFSHVGLINTACNLTRGQGPADHRTQT